MSAVLYHFPSPPPHEPESDRILGLTPEQILAVAYGLPLKGPVERIENDGEET